MEKYESPEMEVIVFDTEDIVADSIGTEGPEDPDGLWNL